MTNSRSRYGLLVSSLGAALLAASVFLPWYRVSVAQVGQGALGRLGSQLAVRFDGLHGTLTALAGQQVGALTAEQALSALPVILLVLAGLALLDALLPLARSGGGVPAGAGGAVVLLGAIAGACVIYRMVAPPTPGGELLTLSLREGAWLSLAGAAMIVMGGFWPTGLPAIAPAEAFGADFWASLTGGPAAGR
jgi:hypothetical protein